jgi:hypothetical protein
MKTLVKEIEESELRKPISRWTGNDASRQHHTGLLNPSESRDFVLHWKKSAGDYHPELVGYFRLRLEQLVTAGWCKREGDKIRVTFYHDQDGVIRLRVRRAEAGGIVIPRIRDSAV